MKVAKFKLGDGVLETIPKFVSEINEKAKVVIEQDKTNTVGLFRADFVHLQNKEWFAYVAMVTACEQKLTGAYGILISSESKREVTSMADYHLHQWSERLMANNPEAEKQNVTSDYYEVL